PGWASLQLPTESSASSRARPDARSSTSRWSPAGPRRRLTSPSPAGSGDNSRVLNLIGNFFSWTVTALFGAITLLLGFESWALLTNHTPITDYIRPAVHAYPGFAFAIAVVIGILVGHFLWGPAYGRTSPVGKK